MSALTLSPSSRVIPFTPAAVRPMVRTSPSLKRIALPELANNMTSESPVVKATSIRSLPSRKSIAIIPLARGRENCWSDVFLTVPFDVAIKTVRSSLYSRIGRIARICSPAPKGNKFTIGRPLEVRLPIGI